MTQEINALEQQIGELYERLVKLRREAVDLTPIPNYRFETLQGPVSLVDLFAGKQTLFVIHNMGQACRYCTLWADGFNGFLPHLEASFAVVLVSKDTPEVQQQLANSRGWRYRMASHGGGAYIKEQSVYAGEANVPGMVCYQYDGQRITRKGSAIFGPGDRFCSIWSILSLAGLGAEEWTPQYSYWKRPSPEAMEDGGQNLE
ncbi:MAG: DUF899 family protein [Verrucomicrobiota bacterium]|nr:DUF899 family protein [Verrucomicrobiota bacterium]